MKVILNSDVTNLGEEGDICTVAPGYARNYLLPKGLVMAYNERNLARIEERRAEIEQRREQKRKEAAGIKERLEMEPLVISMTAGINGKLFGSVTSSTIVESLAAKGMQVERKRIDVPDHSLKAIGTYKVRVKLYADQEAVLTVKVEAANARELEEKRARLGSRDPGEVAAAVNTDAEAPAEAAAEDAESEASDDPEVIAIQQAIAEESSDETGEENPVTADVEDVNTEDVNTEDVNTEDVNTAITDTEERSRE